MQEVLITNLASVMYKRYAEKNMQDLKRHMVSLINNDCLMHCSLIVLLINRTKQYNTQRKKNQSQKLNFLDANITNNGIGKNDIKINLRNAITNKNPIYLLIRCIFEEFVCRAKDLCSEKHLKEELNFVLDMLLTTYTTEGI